MAKPPGGPPNNPGNKAPVALNDTAITDEDGPVAIGVLANDTDKDGDPLTVTAVNAGATIGTVTIAADGSGVTYDPNGQFESLAAGATASDSFLYTVEDPAGASAEATVTVTITGVNDAPVAADDLAAATENGPAVAIDVLANDDDVDSDDDATTLTVTSASAASGAEVGGTGVPGGGLSYDPSSTAAFESLAAGETTTDTITYTITDRHGATAEATVEVTVTGVNDQPVANAVSESTTEDAGVFSLDLLDPAVTSDIDASDVLAITGVVQNVATSDRDLGGAFSVVDGVLSFDTDLFTDLPAGASETLVFDYTVDDGSDAPDATATNTATITVTGINDAPVAVDDGGFRVHEDTPLRIIPGTLLANDTDADRDILTISSVSGAVDGEVMLRSKLDILFTPNADFNGSASFEYTVDDGNGGTATATVEIIVDPVNDVPVAQAGSLTTDEDVQASGQLLATDVDGDTLTFSLRADAAHGDVLVNAEGSSPTRRRPISMALTPSATGWKTATAQRR